MRERFVSNQQETLTRSAIRCCFGGAVACPGFVFVSVGPFGCGNRAVVKPHDRKD